MNTCVPILDRTRCPLIYKNVFNEDNDLHPQPETKRKDLKGQMKRRGSFYCILCWQEFDDLAHHNRGSFFGFQKLNGDCPGDIRRREPMPRGTNQKAEFPALDLEAGEPIRFGKST